MRTVTIECRLLRQGGTKVEIGGTEYHFKPSKTDTRHIALIENVAHAERFLAIPEAYGLIMDGEPLNAPVESLKPGPDHPVPTAEEIAAKDAAAKAAGEAKGEPTVAKEGGKWFVKQGEEKVSPGFKSEALAKAELARIVAEDAE